MMLTLREQFGSVAANIANSNAEAARSIDRLASGDRITRAADDVASLSVSTSLTTAITALRQARTNAAQAESLLQVMEGGLREIDGILQRMNALSVQANSGTLTSAERGFLDQEFQNLYREIDRIAEQTTFGNLQPLKALNFSNAATFDTQAGRQYEAYLNFETNWNNNNQFIRLGPNFNNNERFFWRNNVNVGDPRYNIQNAPTLEGKARNLVEFWNNPNSITQTDERFNTIRMELVSPTRVKITSLSRGEPAQLFFISDNRSSNVVQNGINTDGRAWDRGGAERDYILRESGVGSATGLEYGSTSVVGQTFGGLINTIQQERAELRLRIGQETGGINNNQRFQVDNLLNGVGPNYQFRNNATNDDFHIQLGANNRETLANLVAFLNTRDVDNIAGGNNRGSGLRFVEFERDGLDMIIRSRFSGTPTDTRGEPLRFLESTTAGTFFGSDGSNINNNDSLTGGADTGINTSGVVNADFVGTISGFQAEFLNPNQVRVSLKVGAETYRATISNTSPVANERYRLVSDNGGYFDIELRGGASGAMSVNNQADANRFAALLDNDFRQLQFYQQRTMSNFQSNAAASLQGSQLKVKSNDFSQDFVISDIVIRARNETQDGNAQISFVVDDEIYTNVNMLDRGIEATATYRFRSNRDANKEIIFVNGNTFFDLGSRELANTFRDAMLRALPARNIEASVRIGFQLDQSTDSKLDVSLVNSTTRELFGDETISIVSEDAAKEAFGRVKVAIKRLTEIRAEVGSTMQRAIYAGNAISSALVNQQAARSALTDTDITFESTQRALALVQANAAIGVLSQANGLKENLISLVIDPLAALSPLTGE